MKVMKTLFLTTLLNVIMGNAICQGRIDSIESRIHNIKYIFINKNSATGNVPPQSTYVHCLITCEERKEFENITNDEWLFLMKKNSRLGLTITAILHDLFKETAVVFMMTESQDVRKWKNLYWKNEIRSWEVFLRTNRYSFNKADCLELK